MKTKDIKNNKVFLKNLEASLNDLASSSLAFYGFPIIPLRIVQGGDFVAYITNEEIVINSNSSLDEGLDFYDFKKAQIGKMCHEAYGHGLHTNFELANKALNSKNFILGEYFDNKKVLNEVTSMYPQYKDIIDKVIFHFANIVEDPIVENLAVKIYPGMKPYIDFLSGILEKQSKENFSKDKGLYNLQNALLAQARRFKNKNEYYKIFPELKKTEKYFDNYDNYPVYEDRLKLAIKIFEIFFDKIKEEMKQEQQMQDMLKQLLENTKQELQRRQKNGSQNQRNQQQQGQQGQPSSFTSDEKENASSTSCSGNTEQDENEQQGDGASTDKGKDKDNSGNKESSEDEGQSSDKGTNSSDKNSDDEKNRDDNKGASSDPEKDEELSSMAENIVRKSAMETIEEIKNSMGKELFQEQEEKAEVEKTFNEFQKVNNDGNLFGNKQYKVNYDKTSSPEVYHRLFDSELKKISNVFSKKVAEAIKERRKGRVNYELDEGSFFDIEAYSRGSEKVFYDINLPKKIPLCSVEVMIDQSGSMDGERISSAIKTALILENFCRTLKIPFEVYGHTYNWDTTINIIKKFEEPQTQANAHKIANGLHTYNCNHDGVAYIYGLNHLKKRKEKLKLFFILSDGQPNADMFGKAAMKEVVNTSKKLCKQQNIVVIPISLDAYSYQDIRSIYGPATIDGSNLELLPKRTAAMLLKEIKRVL